MDRGKSFTILLLMACAGLVACSGCGGAKKPAEEEKLVAKINNYNMTSEDFRNYARAISGTNDEILEEAITRNVLVQEAQRENFDKDKAFMKEIERYWEQALLKLLIKKKTAEFSTAFKGDKRKVEIALEEWVNNLRSRASVKIYKENLDAIKDAI